MNYLNCPNCSSNQWQINSLKDRCLCMICKITFELTKVNAWYKGTILEMKNMEQDKKGDY